MPEVPRHLSPFGQQRAQDAFTAQHVGGPLGGIDPVQVEVGVAVVAEFEARVEPRVEQGDPRGIHDAVDFELVFVDETNRRYLMLLQHCDQLLRNHGLLGVGITARRPDGEVVDGNGHAPQRLWFRR